MFLFAALINERKKESVTSYQMQIVALLIMTYDILYNHSKTRLKSYVFACDSAAMYIRIYSEAASETSGALLDSTAF